jgi:hypothetical protein
MVLHFVVDVHTTCFGLRGFKEGRDQLVCDFASCLRPANLRLVLCIFSSCKKLLASQYNTTASFYIPNNPLLPDSPTNVAYTDWATDSVVK